MDQLRVLNAVHEHFRLAREDGPLPRARQAARPRGPAAPPARRVDAARSAVPRRHGRAACPATRMSAGRARGPALLQHGREALDLLARAWLTSPSGRSRSCRRRATAAPSHKRRDREALRLTERESQQVRRCSTSTSGRRAQEGSDATRQRRSRRLRVRTPVPRCTRRRTVPSARSGRIVRPPARGRRGSHALRVICNPPTSRLDGGPIVLRVENAGPTETFEATVVDVTTCHTRPPRGMYAGAADGPRKEY